MLAACSNHTERHRIGEWYHRGEATKAPRKEAIADFREVADFLPGVCSYDYDREVPACEPFELHNAANGIGSDGGTVPAIA